MNILPRSRLYTALPLVTAVALAACEDDRLPPASGVDLTAMAPNADPCQDFYVYACGGWIAKHPIPPDARRVSRFDDAFYKMVPVLRDIVEKDAAGMVGADDPDGRTVGRYYQSCLNAPQDPGARASLATMIAAINAIGSLDDLARQAAAQRKIGSGTFFSAGVIDDVSDPNRHVFYLDQGGIEMARFRYLDPTEAPTVEAYTRHIGALASFFPALKIDAAQVLQIETALAHAGLGPDDRRDPRRLHHRMSPQEVAALAPTFPWSTYWQAMGLDGIDAVDVALPDYLTALEALLQSTPLPALKMYMAWQLIEDKATWMDDAILAEDFDFWDRIVNDVATPSPRWWTCYVDTVGRFGTSLARPYVARHYSSRTTDDITTLIMGLRTALAARIGAGTWLDGPTQAEAQAKLTEMAAKVGHPTHWPTLDGLAPSGGYADQDLQIDAWSIQRTLDDLAHPVDHGLWSTTPVTVNAFYSATDNAITIPAGILQLPFFGEGYSIASNYGAIGAVLGHELTHGFDSSGRLFDGTGTLRDWWTPETAAAFESRAQCLVDQYSSYPVTSSVPVDGRLTLPENIADIGGLDLAYDAWTATGQHEDVRGGLDGRQQFFVAFAQMHCANARTAYLETLAHTDPHTPWHQRVNGTLANVPAAGQAFSCPPGTPLAPTTPCTVW